MQNNTVETLIGALVVAVAAGFLFFAYSSTGSGAVSGYEITAKLARVDGIATGADVQLSGIKIGTVSSLELDPKTYQVTVHIRVKKGVPIPDDSSLMVTASGLLGGSYLAIQPGGSDTMLADGGKIMHTQGSVDLMGLIGRFIGGGSGGSNSAPAQPQPNSGATKPSGGCAKQ